MHYLAVLFVAILVAALVWLAARATDPGQARLFIDAFDKSRSPPACYTVRV